MSTGGGKHVRVCINDTDLLERGPARLFMARDSAASENSVQRVLFIKAHDAARFDALKELATSGDDLSTAG